MGKIMLSLYQNTVQFGGKLSPNYIFNYYKQL